MPIYRLVNGEDSKELTCSWGDLQKFLKENPEWKQTLSTPKIVSGIGSTVVSKTDDGWKEVLSKIKKGSGRGHTIKD